MQVFKSKRFAKFARKERIDDVSLCKAVRDAERGLIDANYGGGVIKQRIARPNEGTSGGYRSIILFRRDERSFFVYGFAKSERTNIDEGEERDFKELAEILLAASNEDLKKLLERGEFKEVTCHEED
ncbi:MAG: type II toxin-antitoxin system RelE/ParE family toxin [Planctomycetota bacterium]|nr:type II toxin-antitoxin system RelE/ParE family toxin [Planctomycetota bacterium]